MFRFLALLLLMPFFAFSQLGFSDDFEDGELITNPKWSGDTSKFKINISNRLQLDDSQKISPAILVTNSTIAEKGVWEFLVELKFAPSASNFCKVYLISDRPYLADSLNGYFVKIGGQSGTVDEVSLFRQVGVDEFKIIDGLDGTVPNKPNLKVKVTRDNSSTWELYIDTSSSFNNPILQGRTLDSTFLSSKYFGLYCRYTSSRSDKFFFDDFRVDSAEYRDTTKPKLSSVDVLSERSVTIQFNEAVDPISVSDTANFFVTKGIGRPVSVTVDTIDGRSATLHFLNAFQNGTNYQLFVSNVKDLNGNKVMFDSLPFLFFMPDNARKRDVVINEIYPDFSPSNGLPNGEFVELFNASDLIFDLNGWLISDGNSSATLPSLLLRPKEFVILCSSHIDTAYSKFGQTLGLSDFPTLNNDGDHLMLIDNHNLLIDEIRYSQDWYKDEQKKQGGYTIEQKDPYTICTGSANFFASNAFNGGTPGKENSIFDTLADVSPPQVVNVSISVADRVLLQFNERLDTSSSLNSTYTFTPPIQIREVVNQAPDYQDILLSLDRPLDSGVVMKLVIEGLKDCEGNKINTPNSTSIVLPQTPLFNDVVINEVLFNPRTGGSDFVELYNRSDKILSLKNWKLANFDDSARANPKLIAPQVIFFFPGDYVAITTDINNILNEYPSAVEEGCIQIDHLPAYNDKEGVVYLLDHNNTILDQVAYSNDQHFELLEDTEGVSLERISADRPSSDPSNFHSAAESVGFATPAYENSQFFGNLNFNGNLVIDPKTFSPDNDGYKDILNINYRFDAPGFVANVSIFDKDGRLIRSLIKSQLLGKKGSFSWDGITDNKTKARIGIYVLYFEAFHPNRKVKKFKEAIVVAGNL